MNKTNIGYAFLGVITLAAILWVYGRLEAYCYLYPSIDTKFAVGYTERAFNGVSLGMSSTQVETSLSRPLFMTTNINGTVEWDYSCDGKCWWGDFAWLGRVIVFSNATVIAIQREVFYD